MFTRGRNILIAVVGCAVLAILAYQIPYVKSAVDWRLEKYSIYIKNTIHPLGPAPTALPFTPMVQIATLTATPTPVAAATIEQTSTPTLAPPPAQASIAAPPYEQQAPNNCGPATLSMALHIYGWTGSQTDIAALIKPVLQDRNVNPEELRYYVRTQAGWLNLEYRVGGTLDVLKRLVAANYPVIVESVTALDPNDALGPTDDLWAAHYILITGYDDAAQEFTIQDSYHGPNLKLPYAKLVQDWHAFNDLYMVIYFPKDEAEVQTLLGSDWDPDQNRQNALNASQAATSQNPSDAFAWFNLGSNLVYFDRYDEAARAYDQARQIGLPLRMFRYQFGPFLAYFHSGRNDDLLALTDYARGVTDMSEETWLWYGFGLYRKGDYSGARAAWQKAEKINPHFYEDQANKALQLVP